MFYKSVLLTLLIPSLTLSLTDAEQKQKAAAKSLAFYKQKAAECAAKNTSALILDITKKAAIGAVLGAGAGAGIGASIVGLHMLDIFTARTLHGSQNMLAQRIAALMPYAWTGLRQAPVYFSEELIKADPYTMNRCTDYRARRCGEEFFALSGGKVWSQKPESEWIVPFETSIKALKTMRWDYLKNNLCLLSMKGATIGAPIGALLGTGYALYKQYYASTPAWLAQLEMLQDSDFAPDPIMLGGKAYLVSQQFQDTSVTEPSYEFYFMPKTAELVTVYKHIIATLETLPADLKKLVACVSVRLVPNTSYSGIKVLPRIVVQLYPHATQKEAAAALAALYAVTKSFEGDGKYPRYSQPVTNAKNNLIYIAFGNGDAKDKNPAAFERKGSWLWRAKDDMAYQNSAAQALSLQ